MVVKLSSLRVSSDFDASSYARGAALKVRSDEQMIASGDALGVALAKSDQNLVRPIAGMARLSRAYIDGYSEAEKFQKAILQVGNAMDKGMDAERAVAMLISIENHFQRVADVSALASKGLGNVASVASTAHVDQTGINSLLGVREIPSGSAQASAAAFEENAREMEKLARSADLLKLQIDPLGSGFIRLNAELAEYDQMLKAGLLTQEQFGNASNAANLRFANLQENMKRSASNTRLSNFELVNLQYQLSDIAVSLQSGQSPFTVMMQQGSQIAQIFQASGASATGSLKAIGSGILTWVTSPTNLMVMGFAAAAAAAVIAFKAIHNALPPIDDLLKKQKADVDDLQQSYGNFTKQLKFLNQESTAVLQFKVKIDAEDIAKSLKKQVTDFLDANQPQQGFRYSVNTQNLAFLPQFKALKEELKAGVPDIADFRKQVVAMYDAAGDDSKMKKLIDSLLDSSDALEKAQQQAKSYADQLRYLQTFQGSSIRLTGPLMGTSDPQMAPLGGFIKDNRSDRQKLEETFKFISENAKAYGEAAGAASVYNRAIAQLDTELAKQQTLAQLDLQSIYAKSPAEKAAIAAARERANALNTSADAQETDMRATMAAKSAYEQATFAMSEAAKARLMSANDNVESSRLAIRLVGASNEQASLANSNLQTRIDLEKEAFSNGTKFDQAQYDGLVRVNAQLARNVQLLAVANALHDAENQLKWSKMNPLEAAIDQKMQQTGITPGSEGYSKVESELQAAQAAERSFLGGSRAAFYEITNDLSDYGKTAKDFWTGLSSTVESTLASAVRTGKLSLDDLNNFALDMLSKLTAKIAMSGIMNLIGGAGGGGGNILSSLIGLFSANGNVFAGSNVVPFAKGGAFTNSVVTRPTMFAYGGKFGVMGEAGPEAVMPLTRGRDGKLGVASQGSSNVVVLKPEITYIGTKQPDIAVEQGSNGQLRIMIEEIADQRAHKAIDKSLPAKYGIRPQRSMR